jgi:Domain of unknown function (DUF4286)
MGGRNAVDAPAVYLVRFWIQPGHEQKVLDWLDGGHIADVIKQPGFLWARRFKLETPDDDGWPAHAMIYGIESVEALKVYFEGEASRRYAKEREEIGLDALLRMDRNWGTLELSLGG